MSDMDKALIACEDAQLGATFIDHSAARVIAAMYHEGQASSTYAFSSTGFISAKEDEWTYLIRRYLASIDDDASDEEIMVITNLVQYILKRVQDKLFGSIPGWSDLWL